MSDNSHSHSHAHEHAFHHHGISHTHSQPMAHDYSNANKQHYDDIEAQKMDERSDINIMGRLIGKAMLEAYPFNEEQTTVMDFACGTGIISRALASKTRKIVGVDISEAMVRRYNLRADRQGLKPEEMHAICSNIQVTTEELHGEKFDVVVCASAYHHFDSIASVTRALSSCLKPDGVLLVTDIAQNAANSEIIPHPHANIAAHRHGFSAVEIETVFKAAGLVGVEFNDKAIENVRVHGNDVTIFLAKGVKPNT